jgi:O-antigen/teichoic acid export membrane protein
MAPLYSAWTPLALSIQHNPAAKHYYATMARYLISMVLLGGLGLGLFAPEILLIFTQPAYLPAAPYVGFLAYIHVFSGISTVLYTSALAGKQLKAVSLTTIVGAGVNILLNMILIPPYGIWGATLATVIGYAIPIIFLYFLLRTRFPVPYPVIRLTAALLVQSGLLWVSLPLLSSISPVHIIIKIFLWLLLLLFLIIFGVISRVEIQQAWLVLRELGAARTYSIMTIKR